MRQTLHIFRKDCRRLRYEIALVLALIVAFGISQARPRHWNELVSILPMLLLPACWYLIAAAVHQEALPGDEQYWLTRPFAWKSLMGAKLLLILLFVSVPLMLVDCAIVAAHGFSPWAYVPSLLSKQMLFTVVCVVPALALATLTRSVGQFALAALVIWAAGVISLSPFVGTWGDWVKGSLLGLLIVAATAFLVPWQYRWRRTTVARAAGICVLALFGVVFLFLPWQAAFAVQQRLSRRQIDSSAVRIAFNPERGRAMARGATGDAPWVQLDIPVEITAVPDGMEVKSDSLNVTIEAPGGLAWSSGWKPWQYVQWGYGSYREILRVDRPFFNRIKDQPLRIRTAVDLTLLDIKRRAAVPAVASSVTVPEIGRCSITPRPPDLWTIGCDYPFKRPYRALAALHVVGTNQMGSTSVLGGSDSYSPYPAELAMSPITPSLTTLRMLGGPAPRQYEIIFATQEPMAHIRRDFEMRDIRLQ